MNRKELTRRTAAVMRDSGVRKLVSSPKQVFHISDDEGNSKDFILRKSDKGVIFTSDDVEAMLNACLSVIEDALKHGEDISIRGFGTLGLQYRKARKAKHPDTGEDVDIEARYVPKFSFGNDLRLCAKMFELSLDEKVNSHIPEPRYDDEYDGEDDG